MKGLYIPKKEETTSNKKFLREVKDSRSTLFHNLPLFISLEPNKGTIIINKGISREFNLNVNHFVTVEELFGKIYIKFTRLKEDESQHALRKASSVDCFRFGSKKDFERILQLYPIREVGGRVGYNFSVILVGPKEFMIERQKII